MTSRALTPAFQHLRQALARSDLDGTADAQLLERFLHGRDEAAFELLVWRHGPMVLGVCRRLLANPHDADDAFQATFLVLARKAGSIGKRGSVGSWLYKVAARVARRARSAARRRAVREQPAENLALLDPRAPADPVWRELRGVLDDELGRLPEKYRAPIVLCYLEGRTNAEAAQQLRCPPGTIKTRLAYARRLLAERLVRRGLALGAALVVAESQSLAASATVPAALARATARAAALVAARAAVAGVVSAPVAGLTEGVLRAMTMTKLKLTAIVLAAGPPSEPFRTADWRRLIRRPAL
jgi:RNA polymerase sigma factor (sigma-70 family)